MINNLFLLPMKIYTKVRLRSFRKKFLYIGEGTGFGRIGYGDCCNLDGLEYISIGDLSWFGKGTSISVIRKNKIPICEIGNRVKVTARLGLVCVENIQIGNDVLIAPDVMITDENIDNHHPEKWGG